MPLLVAASFLAAMSVGIWRFGFPENTSTVQVIDSTWTYTTDTGQNGSIILPNVLSLPVGTEEVRFTTTLPEWTDGAYALHFVSMEQMVEVLVDGERRYNYGTSPDATDFVYLSAHHINQALLKQEDSGKEVTIIYRSSPLFLAELGLLREVRIGTMSDLVLDEFGRSIPYTIISFFVILTCLLSLIMLITYRDMSLRGNLCVLLLAVVTVAFFNSENSVLWSILHHSPILSALVDWSFYYLDPIVHFAAWLSLYATGWRLRGFGRWMPLVFGMIYTVATVLSLIGFFNFNLARPFFMVVGFVFTMFWIRSHMKHRQKDPLGFSVAVLLLLAGYYLDYMKYCLMLLPMSARWSVFLQLKIQFNFFTGIVLIIFSVLVLRETMEQLAKHKADIKVEAAKASLLVEHAKQQYESIVQRDVSLRSIKHDMQFHFRTVSVLLSDGQIEEAERYLEDLGNTVAAMRVSSWCADYIANITISWYADRFSQHDIPFSVTADIPEIKKDVHADISCILSNALQNALEGCAGQAEPFVRLSAKPKGNELLLRIENCCSNALSSEQAFHTTKEGEGHGLGIASMEAAAKRQNGYFKACANSGVFRVDVVLCGVFATEK